MQQDRNIGIVLLKNDRYKVVVRSDLFYKDYYLIYTLVGRKNMRILRFKYDNTTLQIIPLLKRDCFNPLLFNAIVFMLYYIYKPENIKINNTPVKLEENGTYDIMFYTNRKHYEILLKELRNKDGLDKIILIQANARGFLMSKNT